MRISISFLDYKKACKLKLCDLCNKIVKKEEEKICPVTSCEIVAHSKCVGKGSWICKICLHLRDKYFLEEKTRLSLNQTQNCEICNNLILNGGKFCTGENDCLKKAHIQCLREDEKYSWGCEGCELKSLKDYINENIIIESFEPCGGLNKPEKKLKFENAYQDKKSSDYEMSSEVATIQLNCEDFIYFILKSNQKTLEEENNLTVISSGSVCECDENEDKPEVLFFFKRRKVPLKNLKSKGQSDELSVNSSDFCELPQKRKTSDNELNSILKAARMWVKIELEKIGEEDLSVDEVLADVVEKIAENEGDFFIKDKICKAVKKIVSELALKLD